MNEGPGLKPSGAGPEQKGTLGTLNLGSTQNVESGAPTEEVDQPAEPGDNGSSAGAGPKDDSGVVVEKAGLLNSAAGVGLVPGLSSVLSRRTPNYKLDIVVFAAILSLALAGLWIEWRLPGRQPV